MRSFGESVVYIYLYIYRDVFIYMYICVRFVLVYGSNRDEHCRDDVSFVCFILLLARVGWMSTVFGLGKISCDSAR